MQLRDYKHIYMIGIGGISMSGLAMILRSWHFLVSGSDQVASKVTDDLIKNGIAVFIGQKKENITNDIDLVVYTAAIKEDNEEFRAAKEKGILMLERGAFLGELTRLFPKTIGISGTHGKTTTTGMVASIFLAAKKDPTIQIGAYFDLLEANYRVGKSPYFIIEACEYADSFLSFQEESAIVLNIDNDHLDYFKNMENMQQSYQKYVASLPSNGVLVINKEDERCILLQEYTNANVVTVGRENADWTYDHVSYDLDGYPSFDLYHEGKYQGRISLHVTGEYNILNSLCAIALCSFYQISLEDIQKGLDAFKGTSRRMEYKGVFRGASLYDDYAHHPTEVKKTAEGILKKHFHESWVIFECHSYSRLKNYLHEFATSLSLFDHIIITDIFPAREKDIYGVHESDLQAELEKFHKDVCYIKTYEDIKNYLIANVQQNDIIITMGAGKITALATYLLGGK